MARAAVGCLALCSLTATPMSAVPRHDKTVQVLIGLAVLALAVLRRQHWPVAGAVTASTATFLLATAGVVAALSVDAAFSLLAGALLLALTAGLARLEPRRSGPS